MTLPSLITIGVVLGTVTFVIPTRSGTGVESTEAPSQEAGPKETQAGDGLPGNLRGTMMQIRRGVKSLEEGLGGGDETRDEALKAVNRLQTLAVHSKSFDPRSAGRLEGDEKSEFVDGYRLKLIELLEEMITLEKALIQRDNEAAEESISNLGAIQSEGHSTYKRGR